jgi:hypothetical protein
VRRRARAFPACDAVWADELVRARLITRYQLQALLREPVDVASRRDGGYTDSCTVEPPDADWPIELGPYVVLERVGRSDLGATFRCRAASGGAEWAIRRIRATWCESSDVTDAIAAAAEAWSELGDVRVAPMTLLTLAPGRVGVATRWLYAANLGELLRAGRRLSPAAAMGLVRDLISVLASADARGLVHGDLKPSNIFVDRRGQPILTDCGLRRAIAGAGLVVARRLPPERYDYVAPEIAAGEQVPDAAGDIYSLGCIFYHLVSGRPPYLEGSPELKLAAHRAGRAVTPRSLGIDLATDARLLLDAALQPDRARRAGSYNDLMSRIPPRPRGSSRPVRSELRCEPLAAPAGNGLVRVPEAGRARNRGSRWLLASAAVAAAVAGVVHGTERLMPLLSLRVPTKSASLVETKYSTPSPVGRSQEPRSVSAIWNATEDFRAACRAAAPHDTITLRSPGPFLLDAIDIAKPITLRGADDIRPLFVGGPGTALRVVASDVRLENMHFLRVSHALAGQERRDTQAMLEVFGDRVALHRCSFEDTSPDVWPSAAIAWQPRASTGSDSAQLAVDSTLFRHVAAAVVLTGNSGVRLSFDECMHLGPGPLVDSTSPRGRPFQSCDVSLSRVTVFGAGTIWHRFPHPLDDALALAVTARQSLLMPRDREQPVLAVRYAAQPGVLMPKVSWSGAETVCPSDALLLDVERGPDAAAWRAADVAAWNAYWGTHATGILGVRMPFADTANSSRVIPRPAVAANAPVGADPSKLASPSDVSIENLPLLVERLQVP